MFRKLFDIASIKTTFDVDDTTIHFLLLMNRRNFP
jgi:hypothetical protein